MIQHPLRFGMVALCSVTLVSNALASGYCGDSSIPNSHYDSGEDYYVCDSGFYPVNGYTGPIIITSRLFSSNVNDFRGGLWVIEDDYVCVRCPPLEGMLAVGQAPLANLHLAVDDNDGYPCTIPGTSPQTDANGNTYIAVQGCSYDRDSCDMPIKGVLIPQCNDMNRIINNCIDTKCGGGSSQNYYCFQECQRYGYVIAGDYGAPILDDWTAVYGSGFSSFKSWAVSSTNCSVQTGQATACFPD